MQVLCLEGFHHLLQTIVSRYPEKMELFLSFGDAGEAGTTERVQFFLRHFQVICEINSSNGTVGREMKDWQRRRRKSTQGQ